MAAHQAPPSLGFSRQEHWSGLPFPSPMHESGKWKWSCSVMFNSEQPHGLQPTRLFHPWDFPGKSTGVGCHCLLHFRSTTYVLRVVVELPGIYMWIKDSDPALSCSLNKWSCLVDFFIWEHSPLLDCKHSNLTTPPLILQPSISYYNGAWRRGYGMPSCV